MVAAKFEFETVTVRVTMAEKPPMLFTVIVEVADEPEGNMSEPGLAEIVKSCFDDATVTVRSTLWVIFPLLVPVTTTW